MASRPSHVLERVRRAAVIGVVACAVASAGCPGGIAPDESSHDAGDEAADSARDASDDALRPDARDGDTGAVGDASDAGEPVDAAEAGSDAADADAALPVCTGDLSGIGAGDFHVSLTLKTTQIGLFAIASQRAKCTRGQMWDLHVLATGRLAVDTDDGTHYMALNGSATVNDGIPHTIVLQRIAGTLAFFVDGVASGSGASLSEFGALVPLRVGTGVCDGTGGEVAFSGSKGTLSDFCLASP